MYKFDYVMRHVRSFALMFGASVFTVSALKNGGMEIAQLYKYILHRLYDFDFKEKPELGDEEGIIIPSGFDTPAFIKQLAPENQEPFENKVKQKKEESGKEEKMFDFKEMLEELKEDHKERRPIKPMTTKAGGMKTFDLTGEPQDEGKSNAIAKLLQKNKKKDGGAPSKTLEALLNRGKKP